MVNDALFTSFREGGEKDVCSLQAVVSTNNKGCLGQAKVLWPRLGQVGLKGPACVWFDVVYVDLTMSEIVLVALVQVEYHARFHFVFLF